jgi:BlaR1 peptidase M56
VTVLHYIGTVNLCLAVVMVSLWGVGFAARTSAVTIDCRSKVFLLRTVLVASFLVPLIFPLLATLLEVRPLAIFVALPFTPLNSSLIARYVGSANSSEILYWLFFAIGTGVALLTALDFLKLKKLLKNASARRRVGKIVLLSIPAGQLPFAAAGPFRAFIGLPEALTRDQQKMALRHEFSHLRRGDVLWVWLVVCTKFLCAWNPFFWLWCNAHTHWTEVACDEDVLRRPGTQRGRYLSCLINVALRDAASGFHEPSIIAGLIGGPQGSRGQFMARVRYLAKPPIHRKNRLGNLLLFSAVIVTTSITASLELDRLDWSSESLHQDTLLHLSRFKMDPTRQAFRLVMGY